MEHMRSNSLFLSFKKGLMSTQCYRPNNGWQCWSAGQLILPPIAWTETSQQL